MASRKKATPSVDNMVQSTPRPARAKVAGVLPPPTPVADKIKSKRKPAARKNGAPSTPRFVDTRSAEMKEMDAKLLARMNHLADTLPPTADALNELVRIRGMIGFAF